jgi:hypothetical protein
MHNNNQENLRKPCYTSVKEELEDMGFEVLDKLDE